MRPKARDAGIAVVLVVAACCLAAAVAAPGSAQPSAPSQIGGASAGEPVAQTGGTSAGEPVAQTGGLGVAQTDDQPDPDNTITRIDLAADGSATWEITLRTRLASEDDLAEYERFQDRFRENTSRYLGPFTDRMTGVVAAANDTSDREMRATGFEAETAIQEVPRRWGVVSFRFTWTGFAATDGDDVVVGDVFDGGFFIGDDDVLAIAAPDGYAIAEAAPTPDELDNGVAEWHGREDFADARPSVRASPAGAGGGPDDGADDGTAGGVDGALVLAGVAALLFAIGLAAVAYAVRSGRVTVGGNGGDSGSESEASAAASSGATAASKSTADSSAQADAEPSTATDESDDGRTESGDGTTEKSDGTTEKSDGTAAPAVDPDLLTDGDRIKRALRDGDGRMKQSAIVEELGWSKSKTSRVLSQMAKSRNSGSAGRT